MSEIKHTPLPWMLGEVRRAGTRISPPPEIPLWSVDIYAPNGSGKYHVIATFTFIPEDEAEKLATARHIIESANDYAAVLSQRDEAVGLLSMVRDTISLIDYRDAVDEYLASVPHGPSYKELFGDESVKGGANAALRQQLAERLEWNKTAIESCGIASGEIAALTAEVERLKQLGKFQQARINILARKFAYGPRDAEIDEEIHNLNMEEEQYRGIEDPEITALRQRCKALEGAKNTAYAERQKMVAALTHIFPAHMKRHPDTDTTWEDDWRNIVCIHGPAGQMTWHIHDSEAVMFGHLNVKPDPFADCEYDGHTTEEKYQRLILAALSRPSGEGSAQPDDCARVCENPCVTTETRPEPKVDGHTHPSTKAKERP